MTSVTMSRVTIDGTSIRCPGRKFNPRRLTFMASGSTVYATCGDRHAGPESASRAARCFFPVDQVTAAALGALGKAKPGRVRVTLPGGKHLEGKLVATPASGASSTSTGRAAAAVAAKGGKTPAPGPAKPAGRATGGSFAAAMNAVAAVAGAVGQTAAAVGQTAGAVGTVASAGASAVGSVSSVAREGIGAHRDGIKAADKREQRRHERDKRESGG